MWNEHVAPVVEDFLIGFQRDPEAFPEDTDLKRDLFSALYRYFSALQSAVEIPRKDLALTFNSERGTVRMTPVKTAYPMGLQFDIAVLELEGENPLSEAEAQSEVRYARYWEQKVATGLQIHLCKADQVPSKYFRKLFSDLKKFASYREEQNLNFSGLTLLLVNGEISLSDAGEYRLEEAGLPDDAGISALVVAENGIFQLYPPA